MNKNNNNCYMRISEISPTDLFINANLDYAYWIAAIIYCVCIVNKVNFVKLSTKTSPYLVLLVLSCLNTLATSMFKTMNANNSALVSVDRVAKALRIEPLAISKDSDVTGITIINAITFSTSFLDLILWLIATCIAFMPMAWLVRDIIVYCEILLFLICIYENIYAFILYYRLKTMK